MLDGGSPSQQLRNGSCALQVKDSGGLDLVSLGSAVCEL
ncbi:unnamed protein product [Arabidopsis halleri]